MEYDDQTNPIGSKSRRSLFLTGLVSAVTGGVIALLLQPLLVQAGILYPQSEELNLKENSGPRQTVSVNVNTDITKAVEKVQPAVVGVVNFQRIENPFSRETVQQGTGSGIIFEKSGDRARVVTNYHVIKGAERISVVIPGENRKAVEAKVLGADQATDLAVLEIPARYVKAVAEFGDSNRIRAGEPAIAIGNPLGLEFSQSVTAGVISSPRRTMKLSEAITMDVIQTDAAINPGNSGGALINVAGQVIGINSLKIAEQGVEGLGFAIPVNDAKPIINDLILYGKVRRPFLGIELRDMETIPQQVWKTELKLPDNVRHGIVVVNVIPGTGASKAGLKQGDVIVALDGKMMNNSSELRSYLWKEKEVGEELKVTFYRGGNRQTKTMTLGERME